MNLCTPASELIFSIIILYTFFVMDASCDGWIKLKKIQSTKKCIHKTKFNLGLSRELRASVLKLRLGRTENREKRVVEGVGVVGFFYWNVIVLQCCFSSFCIAS